MMCAREHVKRRDVIYQSTVVRSIKERERNVVGEVKQTKRFSNMRGSRASKTTKKK